MDNLQNGAADVESLGVLSRFRLDLHACLTARTDELCELADVVLCAGGPVRSLAGLSLPSIATGVPLPGVITASGLLDGSATLVEAFRRARKFGDWLCALADADCELEGLS